VLPLYPPAAALVHDGVVAVVLRLLGDGMHAAVAAGPALGGQEQAEPVAGLPVEGGVGHVPGAVAQRQADLGPAALLAVGVGVVGAEAEVLGELPAAGQLGALDRHLVDVHRAAAAGVAELGV